MRQQFLRQLRQISMEIPGKAAEKALPGQRIFLRFHTTRTHVQNGRKILHMQKPESNFAFAKAKFQQFG